MDVRSPPGLPSLVTRALAAKAADRAAERAAVPAPAVSVPVVDTLRDAVDASPESLAAALESALGPERASSERYAAALKSLKGMESDTDEELALIRARTMHDLVEIIDGGRKRLLFLSGKQPAAVAESPSSIARMLKIFSGGAFNSGSEHRPQLVINLLFSGGFDTYSSPGLTHTHTGDCTRHSHSYCAHIIQHARTHHGSLILPPHLRPALAAAYIQSSHVQACARCVCVRSRYTKHCTEETMIHRSRSWAAGMRYGSSPFLGRRDTDSAGSSAANAGSGDADSGSASEMADTEEDAQGRIDAFMETSLIPLAIRTHAIVLCDALSNQNVLSASFNRISAVMCRTFGETPYAHQTHRIFWNSTHPCAVHLVAS